jgi:hypothetical protein
MDILMRQMEAIMKEVDNEISSSDVGESRDIL